MYKLNVKRRRRREVSRLLFYIFLESIQLEMFRVGPPSDHLIGVYKTRVFFIIIKPSSMSASGCKEREGNWADRRESEECRHFGY